MLHTLPERLQVWTPRSCRRPSMPAQCYRSKKNAVSKAHMQLIVTHPWKYAAFDGLVSPVPAMRADPKEKCTYSPPHTVAAAFAALALPTKQTLYVLCHRTAVTRGNTAVRDLFTLWLLLLAGCRGTSMVLTPREPRTTYRIMVTIW